ncbi:sugar transferase [Jannaschia rubra]|uniref:sugar transferase n=1 Tax=Jannaschia rubra TaxID=282197 RepID=UPI002491B68E|nr:sugar transferase [Jannaschia rubra]
MRPAVGFRSTSPRLYRLYNVVFAIALLVLLAPLLLLIAGMLAVTQGPKVLYRGPRIGKDKRQFQIIKFRTLCPDRARTVTADRTLPADANIETPLGKFFRETRLDELPQLLNIVRGDMNICGPRPVRAEIAAIEGQRIPDYDLRFAVRPGLIGPTQACFGHSASKRLRARMNNRAVRRPVSIGAELALLGRIGLSILQRLSGKIETAAGRLGRREGAAPLDIWLSDDAGEVRVPVLRIDLRSVTLARPPVAQPVVPLSIRLESGAVRRARVRLTTTETRGLFAYEAVDELSAFVIERYALSRVVIPPRVARVAAPGAQPDMVARHMGA